MSPTTAPAERAELDAFWRELREVNSIITSLGKQAWAIRMQWIQSRGSLEDPDSVDSPLGSAVEFLRAQASELDGTRHRLEDVRDFLRMSINTRVRPTLRPLNVLSLPNELLRQIFKYVRGGLNEHDLYFFDRNGGDVGQVKALRQVCRRFCDTSSHLLLRYVKVDITRPSIMHLEEVSRQPVISKGIRAIQVNLKFYDSVLASDIHAFAAYQASRLRSSISSWQLAMDHLLNVTKVPREVYATAIAKASPIAESWEDTAVYDSREESINYNLLHKAHEQYKQRYIDQTILRQGTFVQAIASAMAKMPGATWLEINDHDIHWAQFEDTFILPRDVSDHGLLLDKLLLPIISWEDARVCGLGHPPAEVIPRLLLGIHQEGVLLTGLTIRTPPPDDLSLLVPDGNQLEAAVKHLRVLDFSPRQMNHEDDFWASRATDEWTPFREFLSSLLSSTSLQRITLELCFLYSNELAPPFSIGPVVVSRYWPKLGDLSFHGPFHLAELRSIVGRAKKGLCLQLSGRLMSGSWAEVLDFMREGLLKKDLAYYSDIDGCTGQELDQMTRREAEHIFSKRYSDVVTASLAVRYVRGWLIKSNPVRDWERGTLVIPEEAPTEVAS